ncbi:MAG: hypothetical protein HOF74_04145 [Gammaproteobacteria bacterium]|jgi:hypothetical protein|nr:hypothetical protein [Gammaproteobacteria bacterium]MBT3858998.1 hypothetical protein [Gammaproteobacteria bacterium]MBT3988050.1 hypothetical protein [Gammaproteobacteria bacterium]MBT4256120.1 hypothetical protein [Gammaproteobacteria bacterium]MBT4583445.1 hypothetical protein [Gammaproteobacteria bacterium]
MISTIIVTSSIIFALVYALAYRFWPGMHERVEQPKYSFQQQLAQHEKHCRDGKSTDREHGNEK